MLFTALALVAVAFAAPTLDTRDDGVLVYATNVRLHPNGDKTLCLQPKGGVFNENSSGRRQELEIGACTHKAGEAWDVKRSRFQNNVSNIWVPDREGQIGWVIGSTVENPSGLEVPPQQRVALQPSTDDDPEPYNDIRWAWTKEGQFQRVVGGTFVNFKDVSTGPRSCITVDGDIAPGAAIKLEICAPAGQVNPKQIWTYGPVPGEDSEVGMVG